jgi:hypothetical protein
LKVDSYLHKRGLKKMVDRLTFIKSKLGHLLSQISELTGLTIDEVKETLGQSAGLTPKDVGINFDMTQRGLTLDQISQEIGVELEVLKQLLPQDTAETHALADTSTTSKAKETHEPEPLRTLPERQYQVSPTRIYAFIGEESKLHWTNLITGEESCQQIPGYEFRFSCRWIELPGGSLFIIWVVDMKPQ